MKKKYYIKNKLLYVLAVQLVASPALAQNQIIPGAGTILQQIKPLQSPAPTPTPARIGPLQEIDQIPDKPTPSGAPFSITKLLITGNTLFDTETLHALVVQAEGQSMPLNRLEALIAAIPAYYSGKNYPLVRVVIPAQVVRDGIVRVEVIEGRYGDISLNDSSQVQSQLLQSALAPLETGQLINQTPLNRTLLLLSDVPGVKVKGLLKPGKSKGTTDLIVTTVQSGPSVTGNITLDNNGSSYTGNTRIAGSVFFVNQLHHGDVLSISILSAGANMNYGRLSYDTLIDGNGTHLGGEVSALSYKLGEPLEALKAYGSARTASIWAQKPLFRSRDTNVYGKFQLKHLQLRDRVDAIDNRTDRHLNNLTASLDGNIRDNFLVGAITVWKLEANIGWLGFDDPVAQSNDAQTAKTDGRYEKWIASIGRLQGLTTKDMLYFNVAGQWAGDNLDSSQKFSAGGAYTVRGYETGAISGDSGYTGTIEWRHELFSNENQRWQGIAFIDTAYLKINKDLWPEASADNTATLSGTGVGVNWTGPQDWSAQLHVATPIGTRPALLEDTANYRAWAEIARRF
ncbi:Polypeptide-transport-associated domain protein, ShlB-type [Psychromonas ingrahamii 37]|uniref:Polypeptide-transport-associated domain protein, ShlB-type n=1 Tax=Psychromonas ingrahamii (strain DSM 17664 / CCUG 51855 / 37) TaxID=357804 RepID=A1SXB4_PSYIN|nr:ShlB/FhaC/HecB family hemolysin secretion/activation protein [Psychromonas ingrahamii]ABM04129.1 Polypeptide-transport-associated domain protein, ShlB-type [Psychromonas ingrahamii 37]